jgi:hypothetical protein
MARIKYQPSTKVRGFNPIQISKEGITQLRNENNRVIQGLKNNFEAERAQQERDRAAMAENAGLEQDRIKRDREIQLENLKSLTLKQNLHSIILLLILVKQPFLKLLKIMQT